VVIPNLKMSSPSAALAKLPDGSAAESLDMAATVAPGAGTPGTFSARTENQPAPPPGLVAPGAVSTVAIPAKLISSTRPVYPLSAKNLNIQGNVVVAATINEKGLVTVAKAVSGPIALRQAGVDSVMQWKYSPALTGGKPSPTEIMITIEFHMK
jgi:TonB family protein